MNLAKLLEDEAHLLLQELREHVLHQVNKGNKANPKIEEILTHLQNHVNPTPAPVVDAAPVVSAVVEPTVVVEAHAEKPQTVAQEQSAANIAN